MGKQQFAAERRKRETNDWKTIKFDGRERYAHCNGFSGVGRGKMYKSLQIITFKLSCSEREFTIGKISRRAHPWGSFFLALSELITQLLNHCFCQWPYTSMRWWLQITSRPRTIRHVCTSHSLIISTLADELLFFRQAALERVKFSTMR